MRQTVMYTSVTKPATVWMDAVTYAQSCVASAKRPAYNAQTGAYNSSRNARGIARVERAAIGNDETRSAHITAITHNFHTVAGFPKRRFVTLTHPHHQILWTYLYLPLIGHQRP